MHTKYTGLMERRALVLISREYLSITVMPRILSAYRKRMGQNTTYTTMA